ncbi:MAG: nuclear transport factor 2 family protein [Bacteroidota bacterium]|nr:nuclear transport factor 2 family protein [Bacteroidota bacterium]
MFTKNKFVISFTLCIIIWIRPIQLFTQDVPQRIQNLHDYLVEQKLEPLADLLHDKIIYGHSNAWLESKKDMIANLQNRVLTYQYIEMDSLQITYEKNIAMARYIMTVKGQLREKEFQLRLSVLQCWIKKRKNWYLIGRQAVKVS